MAEKRIDMKIKCPFYLSTYGRVIRCSPIVDACSTNNTFPNQAKRNAYINRFCACYSWHCCVIAKLCEEKYQFDSGMNGADTALCNT